MTSRTEDGVGRDGRDGHDPGWIARIDERVHDLGRRTGLVETEVADQGREMAGAAAIQGEQDRRIGDVEKATAKNGETLIALLVSVTELKSKIGTQTAVFGAIGGGSVVVGATVAAWIIIHHG